MNRISLGVQTTNDKILQNVNRDHNFEQVETAIRNLKEQGIDNINVDLILGLPHSSKAILKQDIQNVLSLDIKHISCYGLTIHPHTVLFSKGYQEPEGDILREYYDIVEDILKENDFIHYEVSNWCKPGYQSEHNLTYWRNEQYYGCGLGASGYIGETRYKNTVNLSQYLKRAFVFEKEHVSEQDKSTYQIMLNLRTIEGLDISFAKNKEKEINELVSSGLLTIKDNHLIPTYEGMMVLDQIILKLL